MSDVSVSMCLRGHVRALLAVRLWFTLPVMRSYGPCLYGVRRERRTPAFPFLTFKSFARMGEFSYEPSEKHESVKDRLAPFHNSHNLCVKVRMFGKNVIRNNMLSGRNLKQLCATVSDWAVSISVVVPRM